MSALAAGFAVLAAALLYLFLSNRGADLGILKSQVEVLPILPIFSSAIFESAAGLLSALLIGVSWFGVGRLVVSRLPSFHLENPSRIFEIAIRTAVGAAIWTLVFFFLGLAGAFTIPVAVIATVVGLAAAVHSYSTVRENENGSVEPFHKLDIALLTLIAVPVVLALITALAPPIAKDTLLYHFSVPKAFVANGGLSYIEGNIASYMSLSTEMHIVWAMLLGGVWSPRVGEAAAGAVIWLFLPILLMAVYGWARTANLSHRWSFLASLMVAAVPTVYYVAASGYIDLASSLFVTLAIFSFGQWWKTQDRIWLIFIAILLGTALAAKLITLFVFAAFALLIVWRARGERGNAAKVVASGFAALVLAGVIAAPWYLRTWVETGSPLFPFYTSVWSGNAIGWDAERSSLIQQKDAQYGGIAKTPVDYLLTPLKLSVNSQPDLITHFDGVLGVGFLFGLTVLGFALWRFDLTIEPKIAGAVAVIVFLFWMFSSQQLRYLLPIFPALAVAVVFSARTISDHIGGFQRIVMLSTLCLSIAGVLVSTSWFLQTAPARTVFGGETRDTFLTRNIDYYPYYQWLNNETPKDARVWLVNMRRDSYHLDRAYLSDYLFEDWTLRKMVWDAKSVEELRVKAAALGVQYALVRHDFMFDLDLSTIVDEKRSRAENIEKLKMAQAFVLDKANTVRADDRFSLIRVL